MAWSFAQYTVATIPDPKKDGQDHYISNPDGILNSSTVENLNNICRQIESSQSAEVAVVVINNYKGDQEIFDFSMKLFRTWGIGKKGKNNGLLLFVAKDRRKYQFITGYGLEGDLTDYQLNAIGKDKIVPNFRLDNYNNGVLEALQEVSHLLLHEDASTVAEDENIRQGLVTRPGEDIEPTTSNIDKSNAIASNKPTTWKVSKETQYVIALVAFILYIISDIRMQQYYKPENYTGLDLVKSIAIFILSGIFVIGFPIIFSGGMITPLPMVIIQGCIIGYIRYSRGLSVKEKEFIDIVNKYNNITLWTKSNWWSILITPSLWFKPLKVYSYKKLTQESLTPPDEYGNYNRLNWDEDMGEIKTILSKAQRTENEINSNIYQIWINTVNHEKKVLVYKGLNYNSYEVCTTCQARTMPVKSTIKVLIKATYSHTGKGEKIKQCRNCNAKISLGFVILPQLQESSSSSSSGSSSSSSSSSSGSWGGGSSGGGGAGGSW